MSRPSYETQARRRKAVTIADYCRAHNMSAQWVTEMTATERREVCDLAFVNLASDETWAVVIGLLGAFEDMHPSIAAVLPDDPDDPDPDVDNRGADFDPSEAELQRYYHSGGGEDPVSRQQIRDAGRPGL